MQLNKTEKLRNEIRSKNETEGKEREIMEAN